MAFSLIKVIPILRIFSVEKAKEFYLGFLGFSLDWDHQTGENGPVFMQVSRNGLVLRLSEHYGDGSPGAAVTAEVTGLDGFHAELQAKKYPYMNPGIEEMEWGARVITVIDPFGNRIHFSEAK